MGVFAGRLGHGQGNGGAVLGGEGIEGDRAGIQRHIFTGYPADRGNYQPCCLACFKAVFSALSAGERRGSDCESGYSHTTPSPSPSCMYW